MVLPTGLRRNGLAPSSAQLDQVTRTSALQLSFLVTLALPPNSQLYNYVSSFCNDARNILITGSHKSSHLIGRGSLSSQRTLWTGSAVFPGDFHILLCGFLLLVPCSHSAGTLFRGPGFKRLPIIFIIIMLGGSI